MIKRKAIIVDLDGTLCDSQHRVHHIANPEGKVDWAKWGEGIPDDGLNLWCAELCLAMWRHGYCIIFLTGRNDGYKKQTLAWLEKHLPGTLQASSLLLMRKAGDHRQDTIVKTEIYNAEIAPTYDVLFAIDDRDAVADMWRKMGIVCLHCDKWTAEMEAHAAHYIKPEFKQAA